jgi:hypothetical protein
MPIEGKGKGPEVMKNATVILIGLIGTVFVVGCGQSSSPSSPSSTASPAASTSSASPQSAQAHTRVGFGFNGTVSGFPTGVVSLTGGGSYDRTASLSSAGGGFGCIESVLQGPLSTSINPNTPGPCLAGEGVRWDTAALLTSTMFKCTGAATETQKPAVTGDNTVVLKADFYRAGNGNDESFTANMIVSDGDLAADVPGVQNLWVQGVGCGTARAVNFSR